MDNKNKEVYLPEDNDILEEIQALGMPSMPRAERKFAELQIKATLRNRKTAHDLDESTRKYSMVLIIFALAQLILGMFQFLFDAQTSIHPWIGYLYVMAVASLIFYLFKLIFKEIDKK